ncbi:nuclear transport factor 2 family protein [Hyphobacterium sp.]|uniref:nuclear transport factor 2 family protein n=1 Tax=Hyphobacterium sp. TaxID=2004662 RepID=UPI003B51753C
MARSGLIASALAVLCVLSAPAQARQPQADHEAVLIPFFEAFNAHDPEAMMAWVSEDIRIVYLSDDGSRSEVQGAENLRQSMIDYFAALPTVRSERLSTLTDGRHVAVRERASWATGNGELRSQTALSVYRINNGRIEAVWYYPETRAQE